MGFFNTEVELIIPPKKKNERASATRRDDKSVARGSCAPLKTLNGYDAIREKIDEDNTLTERAPATRRKPVEQTTKPKTKVSIGL